MAPWRYAANAVLSLLCLAGTSLADVAVFNNVEAFNKLVETSEHRRPKQTFRSSSIIAPVFNINLLNQSAIDDADYLFIGSVYGSMKAGPMILDAKDLSLVYADQQYDNAYSSDVFEINGKRHLVFWAGGHQRGHANGHCLVFNEQYELVYNVTARDLGNAQADMHEVKITDNRTAIFTTYWNVPHYNFSSIKGPEDALLMDSGFQEVDLETNELRFTWAASQHFNVADSYARYGDGFGVGDGSGFDFAHINSVEKTADGNYLISNRHLSNLALIDGRDGHPIWILGGRRNQFGDLSNGTATNFGWQHDARFLGDDGKQITMFDNHGENTEVCKGPCKTRGLQLEIDTAAMTARVVREYFHPQSVNSGAMGGFRTLASGNVLAGWGYNPSITEYAPDGTVVMDVQRGQLAKGFQSEMFSYRVSKSNWEGKPAWLPSVAVDAPQGTTRDATLHMSWNGATGIKQWVVLSSDYVNNLDGPENVIATANRTGFETSIHLGTDYAYRYIAVAALSASGEVLGSSYVTAMSTGRPVLMPSWVKSVQEKKKTSRRPAKTTATSLLGGAAVVMGLLAAARYMHRRRVFTQDVEKARYMRLGSEERRED